jgi:EAL and modified HD-GYP domain-containing signal transduction protein
MEFFVARQPIFDPDRNVFGYEMLFRSSLRNVYDGDDPSRSGSSVILHSFFSSIGVEDVLDHKRAFFNFDRQLLMDQTALLLPKDRVVIELLETLSPDPPVIEQCTLLKDRGYTLALDDFVDAPQFRRLLELADIIKVDVLATPLDEQRRLVDRYARRGITMLAEKIETPEAFAQAQEIGYRYFQGYFFARPAVLRGQEIPGMKLNYARLLRELNEPQLNVGRLEEVLRQDVGLSYRLLKYLSSPLFGFHRQIESLPQALMLLGETSLRKWFSLAVLAGLGDDKPRELVISALLRAFFCESLAAQTGLNGQSGEMFLLGLFSHLDAFLDRPFEEALAAVDIPAAIGDILTGQGAAPKNMAAIYEVVCCYERGNWDTCLLADARLPEGARDLRGLYLNALQSIREVLQSP